MTKVRIIVAVVAAVVLLVLILQNTAAVETRLLFATVTMPRAVLLVICGLVGFVLGLLTAFQMQRRGKGA